MTSDDDLTHAREIVERIGSSLPAQVDVAAVGVRDKAPFFALCVRESLFWRVEELGRNATEALRRGDQATGIILTRCVTEAAAMMWRLLRLVERRAELGPEALYEDVQRMWLGWKSDPGEMPEAVNVLTMIDHLDKEIPNVRKAYDHLSEVAHPNWSGVAGLYCKTDYEEYIAHFGRGIRGDRNTKTGASLLVASLSVFEHAYNRLADVIPVWLSELEPFGSRDDQKGG